MKTNMSLTTLIAAATMAFGGVALAQTMPPTSTAGAGCTATANAMKGGNLGGSPSSTACGTTANAAPAAATTTTGTAPMTSNTTSAASTDTGAASTMGTTAAAAPSRPVRVARAARADRN